jgi:hypothetical protein
VAAHLDLAAEGVDERGVDARLAHPLLLDGAAQTAFEPANGDYVAEVARVVARPARLHQVGRQYDVGVQVARLDALVECAPRIFNRAARRD